MHKDYRHLTELDRVFISMMIQKGFSKTKIAEALDVHRSTIYRELKRNRISRDIRGINGFVYYIASKAHQKYLNRRKKQTKLESNINLRQYVEEKLNQGWSPWQIEGRLTLENNPPETISHESIYRYIYSSSQNRQRFYKKLRQKHYHRHPKNSRRKRVPDELKIQNRPQNVNERAEFGHWECDLMLFKRGRRCNLITVRERQTRFAIAIKNFDKTAKGTAIRLISTLSSIKHCIRSITFDQGSEFMQHKLIGKCLNSLIYFCDPASPHQKGAVENINSVIRCELPRTTNIDSMTELELQRIMARINHRPLKCLAYQSPFERFRDNFLVSQHEV